MDSMEQIYKEHTKTVYGFLLSRAQQPDIAEELTQETFYRAVRKSIALKERVLSPPGSVASQKTSGWNISKARKKNSASRQYIKKLSLKNLLWKMKL